MSVRRIVLLPCANGRGRSGLCFGYRPAEHSVVTRSLRGDVIALNIVIAFFCYMTPYCLVYR